MCFEKFTLAASDRGSTESFELHRKEVELVERRTE